MKAHVLTASYDQYGGNSTIACLLEQASKSSDCDIETFLATVCFRTSGNPKQGLEDRYSEFHEQLAHLPIFRWERSKRRLSIRYESRLGTAEKMLHGGLSSTSVLQSAVKELADLLTAHESILCRKPGLPFTRFLALVRSLRDMIPGTDEELATLQQQLYEQRRAERGTLPWWEQLGIDWSDYHPKAREILNAPFFWSGVDGNAPHGNDTGADLFSDFRKWRRSHRASSPMAFLEDLFRAWGFSAVWKNRPVKEWDREVEMAIEVYDDAAIALAFALIKLEGSCAEASRAAALEAIGRQLDSEVAAHFGWKVPAQRVAALGQLRAVLECLGEPSRR
jgi:uncharacterized protein YfeS